MDWLTYLVEKTLLGLSAFIGNSIGAAGEKVDASLPVVRPMDKFATARRMSRDGYPFSPGHFVSSITYRDGLTALPWKG